jgi:L-malate glycosyltransferase
MTNEKISTLHITTKLVYTGPPYVLRDLLSGNKKNGFNDPVYIMSDDGPMREEMELFGAKIIQINVGKKHAILNIAKGVVQLSNIIKSKDIDIVVTHSRIAHVIGFIVSVFLDVKHVIVAHGRYWPGQLANRTIRLGRNIVAISKTLKQYLIEDQGLDSKRVHAIQNGIDADRLEITVSKNDLKKSLGLEGKVIIGVVSRVVKEKGHRYLVDAFVKLRDIYPDAVLLIVGDGDYKQELEEYVVKSSISNQTIFSGRVDNIANYINIFDVFVFPSVFESYALVLLEAMILKTPVICSRAGGLVEIVKNKECGLLVEPGNPDAISEAIIYILHNKERTQDMVDRAYTDATSYFSDLNMSKQYRDYFIKLLNE